MTTRHRLFFFLLLTATTLILTGCTTNQAVLNKNGTKPMKLRVGVSTNAPPFVYKTSDGKLQGLEIEFGRQLGKFLNREVVFVELDWDNQIPTLEKGKTDIIMSGMTATMKRQYRVAFTKPYMRSGQILLARSSEANRYSDGIYSLMGRSPRIGTVEGTTGDQFITKTINRPNLTRFPTSFKGVEALANGDIDVLVHDAPILCHYAATYEKAQLTPVLQMATEEYLAWAINKNNPELLKAANEFITANGNNKLLQESIHRWIPYL